MLNKQHQILRPFIQKPWKRFTFKEIKLQTKKKSESYVYNILKKFTKENILKQEKAGNVVLYSLNLAYTKSQVYAGITAEHMAWNKKHIPYKDLNEIASKIPTNFFIFIITGSYAKNNQIKDSDIDLVIICDNTMEPKKIYAELRLACEMNIPEIHLYVFKESEFLQMLLNNQANYGKEIANNNLILSGGKEYFQILAEAINNGFKG